MSAPALSDATVAQEAGRRRGIAVISHPDAGKSTLTEALALHAHAVDLAGAVHGKGGRAGTVSDWLEIERTRGISITSAALTHRMPSSTAVRPSALAPSRVPSKASSVKRCARACSAKAGASSE